jgi:hypothetical protein
VSVDGSGARARRSSRSNSPSAGGRRAAPLLILVALGLGLLVRPRADDRLAAPVEPGGNLTGPDEAREPAAVQAGAVAAVLAGFLLFVVLVTAGLFAFYRREAHGASFVKVATFTAPRLQTLADGLADPEIARQKADLNRRRWVDADHRVLQIPIESAMALVAARGAKAYDSVPPSEPESPQQRQAP